MVIVMMEIQPMEMDEAMIVLLKLDIIELLVALPLEAHEQRSEEMD